MTRSIRAAFLLFACLALTAVSFAQAQTPAAQKPTVWPTDMKKLYQELAGDYLFDFGGQSQTVQFVEREGVLYGAPYGETEETIVPVKDKPYHFEVTVQGNGNFFQLEFVRNDKGEFAKCILITGDMTVEGLKQAKKLA